MAVKIGPGVPEFAGTRRFRVLRRLGSGGMGLVYEALDLERDERVALKTLHRVDPQDLFRLKREFRALQGLEHQNLVRFGELVQDAGRWFFTMELVEGRSFVEHVRRRAPGSSSALFHDLVDELRLRDALGQLANGLCALHDAGKVHRDVKPSNVLVTEEGRVVLLDFGLIKDLVKTDRATTTDVVMGSAGYLSPEQATGGHEVGPAADWYAVGSMLYEALTGRTPFVGAFLEVLYAKMRGLPPPPSQLVQGIPSDLDSLCMSLLAIDPTERPVDRQVLALLGEDEPPTLRTGPPAMAGRRPEAPPPSRAGGSPTLAGRQPVIDTLRRAFEEARLGPPMLAVVTGPTGIGKTAVLRRFIDEIESSGIGAVVLEGRCAENESLPYKALDAAIDALSTFLRRLDPLEAVEYVPPDLGALRQIFPVLDRADVIANAPSKGAASSAPGAQRQRAFAALREMLRRIAKVYPLVIVVDDLQWGDLDSARALGEILRLPDGPQVLVAGAARSDDPRGEELLERLETCVTAGGVTTHRLHLEPLDEAASRQLAREWLGSTPPPDAEAIVARVAEEARGNPALIRELVRYLKTKPPRRRAAAARGPDLTLEVALEDRLASVTGEERRVLDVLAVSGGAVTEPIVALAAGVAVDGVAAILRQLRSAGLVEAVEGTAGRGHGVASSQLRQAILSTLDGAARRELHRRLAEALASASSEAARDPEALFRHCFEAGRFEQAGHHAEAAALQAVQVFAFDRAVTFLELALRLSRGDPRREAALQLRLAEALANSGRRAEAGEALLVAAASAAPVEALELRRAAVEHLLAGGRVDRALEAARAHLLRRRARPRVELWTRLRERDLDFEPRRTALPSGQRADLDARWSGARVVAVAAPADALEATHDLAGVAVESGHRARAARCLALLLVAGGGSFRPGSRTRERLVQLVRRLCREVDSPETDGWYDLAFGAYHLYEGRSRSASISLEAARTSLTASLEGAAPELSLSAFLEGLALLELGAYELLGRLGEAWRVEAATRDDRTLEAVALALGAWGALAADDATAAADHLDAAETARTTEASDVVRHLARLARCDLALYLGGQHARQWLDAEGWPFSSDEMSKTHSLRFGVLLRRARAALALAAQGVADGETLLERAERDAMELSLSGLPSLQAAGAALRAAIAWLRGDRAQALELLATATTDSDGREGSPVLSACARWRQGLITGSATGRRGVDSAAGELAKQGIVAPERWLDVLVPGFL